MEPMTMKLKDFCIRKGWALTYAMVRYDLASGKVLVNSEVPENEDVRLKRGDIVSYGKHRVETVSIRDFIEIDTIFHRNPNCKAAEHHGNTEES